jgi:hypothetical protein
MAPVSHRATLMSATCLATVTHVPTVQPGRGAAAMSMAVVSLASGLALSSPAHATLITFTETSTKAVLTGNILDVGDNTGFGANGGFVFLDGTSNNYGMVAKNVAGQNLAIVGATQTSWISLGSIPSSISSGSSDAFTVTVNPTGRTRGAASGTFTYRATPTVGASETNTITVRTTFVAPVASGAATTVYALAGSGTKASTAVTLTNIGDGNKSGLGAGSNLSSATSTFTTGTGWSGTANATNSLADGASSSAGTFTYTPQASRQTNTATVKSVFNNGNPNQTNAAVTLTTTLTGVTVAPQNTTTATGTTLYALPGKTATGSFVIKNVGDGSFVSKTLDGTLTTTITAGKGVTSSTANGNFNLADGKTGPAATTLTQTLTYTGQTRGASTAATVTASFTNGNSSGNNTGQTVTTTFAAQTVAPVASVTPTVSFGTLRTGTTATQTVTVKNTGDGNLAGADNGTTVLTNLRGTVGIGSGAISGGGGAVNLTDGTSASYTFTYAPTARGTSNVTVGTALTNGTNTANAAGTINTTMSGTAVGPVYDAKLNGNAIANTGTVGFVSWGGAAIQTSDLLISNITTDVAASNLTDLTLTFSIIGDATKEFQLSFDGGTTYGTAGGPMTVAKSAFKGVKVQFTNKVSGGDGFAQLRVATDEGAPLGGSGAIYVYNLSAIPEPGTLAVLGVGLLGLAVSRQRRRGRAFAALTAPPQQEDPSPPTAR